jgi:cell wall-associated NlpC family hydrolase
VAAAGLFTAAIVSAGAAVAATSAPAAPDRTALADAPATTTPATTTPAAGREPSAAGRSSVRTPLAEGARRHPDQRDLAHQRHAGPPGNARHAGQGRDGGQQAGRRTGRRQHTFAERAHRVLQVARAQRGKPYVWGAAGPRAFDCSGYVQWVYRRAVGRHLPKYTDTQWTVVRHISRHQLRPGDLVFVGGGRHKSHVGIYAGHWTWWVAPHTGSHIKKQPIWPARHTFARVLRSRP